MIHLMTQNVDLYQDPRFIDSLISWGGTRLKDAKPDKKIERNFNYLLKFKTCFRPFLSELKVDNKSSDDESMIYDDICDSKDQFNTNLLFNYVKNDFQVTNYSKLYYSELPSEREVFKAVMLDDSLTMEGFSFKPLEQLNYLFDEFDSINEGLKNVYSVQSIVSLLHDPANENNDDEHLRRQRLFFFMKAVNGDSDCDRDGDRDGEKDVITWTRCDEEIELEIHSRPKDKLQYPPYKTNLINWTSNANKLLQDLITKANGDNDCREGFNYSKNEASIDDTTTKRFFGMSALKISTAKVSANATTAYSELYLESFDGLEYFEVSKNQDKILAKLDTDSKKLFKFKSIVKPVKAFKSPLLHKSNILSLNSLDSKYIEYDTQIDDKMLVPRIIETVKSLVRLKALKHLKVKNVELSNRIFTKALPGCDDNEICNSFDRFDDICGGFDLITRGNANKKLLAYISRNPRSNMAELQIAEPSAAAVVTTNAVVSEAPEVRLNNFTSATSATSATTSATLDCTNANRGDLASNKGGAYSGSGLINSSTASSAVARSGNGNGIVVNQFLVSNSIHYSNSPEERNPQMKPSIYDQPDPKVNSNNARFLHNNSNSVAIGEGEEGASFGLSKADNSLAHLSALSRNSNSNTSINDKVNEYLRVHNKKLASSQNNFSENRPNSNNSSSKVRNVSTGINFQNYSSLSSKESENEDPNVHDEGVKDRKEKGPVKRPSDSDSGTQMTSNSTKKFNSAGSSAAYSIFCSESVLDSFSNANTLLFELTNRFSIEAIDCFILSPIALVVSNVSAISFISLQSFNSNNVDDVRHFLKELIEQIHRYHKIYVIIIGIDMVEKQDMAFIKLLFFHGVARFPCEIVVREVQSDCIEIARLVHQITEHEQQSNTLNSSYLDVIRKRGCDRKVALGLKLLQRVPTVNIYLACGLMYRYNLDVTGVVKSANLQEDCNDPYIPGMSNKQKTIFWQVDTLHCIVATGHIGL